MRIFVVVTYCFFYLLSGNMQAQNAPVLTAGVALTIGNQTTIPVTVSNFSNIGSFQLKLLYNTSIASAASMTAFPQLGGSLATNLNMPGIITISWFKTSPNGVSLPSNTTLFNIVFNRTGSGTTALQWDETNGSCLWFNASYQALNQHPFSNYYIPGSLTFLSSNAPNVIFPALSACSQSQVEVPLVVSDFEHIGTFFLTFAFDQQVLSFAGFINHSGFPGITMNSAVPGNLTIQGSTSNIQGFSLPDNATLLSVVFDYNGGLTELNWVTTGTSCQFTGPAPSYPLLNHTPLSQHFINGTITESPLPGSAGEITGPPNGIVRQGQGGYIFSTSPVVYAESYFWQLPQGAKITEGNGTNTINVLFTENAISGNITVSGVNACGSGQASIAFPVTVLPPVVVFEQVTDPLPVQSISSPFNDFYYSRSYENTKTSAWLSVEDALTFKAITTGTGHTRLRYYLPSEGGVQIRIFNLAGQLIGNLKLPLQASGVHDYIFSAEAGGVYVATLHLVNHSYLIYKSLVFICNSTY